MITDEDREIARKYAPILQKMVELMGAEGNEHLSMDGALTQAAQATSIEVPESMRGPLFMSCFQVISSGRVPGAPDA